MKEENNDDRKEFHVGQALNEARKSGHVTYMLDTDLGSLCQLVIGYSAYNGGYIATLRYKYDPSIPHHEWDAIDGNLRITISVGTAGYAYYTMKEKLTEYKKTVGLWYLSMS